MAAKARTRKAPAKSNARARTKTDAKGSLIKLAARIERKLGSPRFRLILETIDEEIAGSRVTRAATQRGNGLPRFRADNAVKTASLRARILAEALSSDQVRTYIDRSRPTINKMAKEGTLLAIADGRNLRFPKWQFSAATEDGLLPGLHSVLAVMDASAFRKAAWFITNNPALEDQTPVDVLRGGDIGRVIEEAKSLVGF